MTTPYRKKLIEVALPLKAINEASAREKSIRHGHPSTLHLWWARRPLAACRAVLFASLVNDPSDDPMYSASEEIAAAERAKLFNLIEELVVWENSNNARVIDAVRAEIARSIAANKVADKDWTNEQVVVNIGGKTATAHDFKHKLAKPAQVNSFLASHAPAILDPFCGGGSIPLEAQRLGLRAHASDLNPVPVLITKALIEIPPRFAGRPPINPEWHAKSKSEQAATVWQGAQGLAEDVRFYGQWMRDQAEKRIGHLYPKVKVTKVMAKDRPDLGEYVGQELTVIAWLWARTVASPNPAVGGARVPLVRSYWLSTKKGKEAWVQPVIDQKKNTYRFEVGVGRPKDSAAIDAGTKIGRALFGCIFTGDPISGGYADDEANAGRMWTQPLAIVAEGKRGRVYLSPNVQTLDSILTTAEKTLDRSRIPTEPARGTFAGNAQGRIYGFKTFSDYFTTRQLLALQTFSDLVTEARQKVVVDAGMASDAMSLENGGSGTHAYSDAVATYLAFAVDKSANYWSSLCGWHSGRDIIMSTFGRQAIPMVWDFAEANPISESSGNFVSGVQQACRMLVEVPAAAAGSVHQLDATAAIDGVASPMVSTDPPYYDNIGYADLSDFFYVWLRRSLSTIFPALFSTLLTPKTQELIASPYRHDGSRDKARAFFERGLVAAFSRMHDVHREDYPLTIFYAFKQSETDEGSDEIEHATVTASTGWETMLEGVIQSGFAVAGTWPMRTELVGNLKKHVAALASSIVLVCRRRSADAGLTTRKDLMNALRKELPEALTNLQQGNVAPVDMAQAAIGPGMAVFTRYSRVVESDGSSMTVRTALQIINQVLDEVLAEQEGDFDPDTRWAVTWFEQYGTSEGPYGVAETLSKAKNTAIGGLVEAGVVKARSGKVQLVDRSGLADDWNPTSDKRLTVWEAAQHLIRKLETKGEAEAATLLNKLGGVGEAARELAYRLYSICEKKKWAEEALAYNSLVIAWPELSKLARANRNQVQPATQAELFK